MHIKTWLFVSKTNYFFCFFPCHFWIVYMKYSIQLGLSVRTCNTQPIMPSHNFESTGVLLALVWFHHATIKSELMAGGYQHTQHTHIHQRRTQTNDRSTKPKNLFRIFFLALFVTQCWMEENRRNRRHFKSQCTSDVTMKKFTAFTTSFSVSFNYMYCSHPCEFVIHQFVLDFFFSFPF